MKHLLTQFGLSVGLASYATVGSPSADRRRQQLKHITFMLLFLLAGVGQVWGATKVISYEDETQDAETTISVSNQSSGTAGKVSWSATSATWNGNSNKIRWEWAANSTITFSVESGYIITQVRLLYLYQVEVLTILKMKMYMFIILKLLAVAHQKRPIKMYQFFNVF